MNRKEEMLREAAEQAKAFLVVEQLMPPVHEFERKKMAEHRCAVVEKLSVALRASAAPVEVVPNNLFRLIDKFTYIDAESGQCRFNKQFTGMDLANAVLKSAALAPATEGGGREEIAKALFARRYQMDAKDVDSMFKWYADDPKGTDRSRVAIYSAFRDADAVLAALSPSPSVGTPEVPSANRGTEA